MKFEPYGDLVDQDFLQFNDNLINNQNPDSRLKMIKLHGQRRS